MEVPALRRHPGSGQRYILMEMDSPSGRVKALDELLDLPHLDILLRYVLSVTHLGRRRVRSGEERGNSRRCWLSGEDLIDFCRSGPGFFQCLHLYHKSSCPVIPNSISSPTIMNTTKKRKLEPATPQDNAKRVKVTSESNQPAAPSVSIPSAPVLPPAQDAASESQKEQERKLVRKKITKLAPPRPFPTVPTSVAATGPRSSHREGRNLICLTRRTKLGAYMRRCKNLILKDG